MSMVAQDVLVSLIALVAAWIVVRPVFGTFAPESPNASAAPGCPSCAANDLHNPTSVARR